MTQITYFPEYCSTFERNAHCFNAPPRQKKNRCTNTPRANPSLVHCT